MLALRGAEPFPLQAQVQIADTRVELTGALTDTLNLGALDLHLKLTGTSLGNLYPLIGVTLPDTSAYTTDGHLIASLHEPQGALFRCEAFNGTIGGSDIHGNLTYAASKPRPKLSGTLVSDQLLFADLAPLIGADSNARQIARGGEGKQPATKVLPGLATTRLFVFDTENAIVYIDGTANMASEQLDLTISPEPKGIRMFSLRSPLAVAGADEGRQGAQDRQGLNTALSSPLSANGALDATSAVGTVQATPGSQPFTRLVRPLVSILCETDGFSFWYQAFQ